MQTHHTKALVFGTGGASKAICYVLQKRQIEYELVSRSSQKGGLTYEEITDEIAQEYQLLINTTPLGTAPNVDFCVAFPYQQLTSQHLLYDLVYNPEETLFLKNGRLQGATTKNGLEMLHLQAERSWEIWNT